MAAGDAALRFGKKYEAAASFYRHAVEADPENTAARWNLGTSLSASGKAREALREYEAVIATYRKKGLDASALEATAAQLRRRVGPTTEPSRP